MLSKPAWGKGYRRDASTYWRSQRTYWCFQVSRWFVIKFFSILIKILELYYKEGSSFYSVYKIVECLEMTEADERERLSKGLEKSEESSENNPDSGGRVNPDVPISPIMSQEEASPQNLIISETLDSNPSPTIEKLVCKFVYSDKKKGSKIIKGEPCKELARKDGFCG